MTAPPPSADPDAQDTQVDRPTRSARHGTGRRRSRDRRSPWWELPALIVAAIVIAVLVKSFVVQPFYIPSDSMEHTLHGCDGCRGDRILVSKLSYDFGRPSPGDIVVFHAPNAGWDGEATTTPPSNVVLRGLRGFGQLIGFVPPDGEILVKRVIAVGGQTIRGSVDGRVQISDNGVNGPYRTLTEPFVFDDPGVQQRAFGPVTIPAGRVWVMGDHRTDSADSRFHCGAGGEDSINSDPQLQHCNPTESTVANGDVIGKAVVIAWPPSRWRTLGTPGTFAHDNQALSAAAENQNLSAAAASVLPLLAAAGVVVPIGITRRRRRRAAGTTQP